MRFTGLTLFLFRVGILPDKPLNVMNCLTKAAAVYTTRRAIEVGRSVPKLIIQAPKSLRGNDHFAAGAAALACSGNGAVKAPIAGGTASRPGSLIGVSFFSTITWPAYEIVPCTSQAPVCTS